MHGVDLADSVAFVAGRGHETNLPLAWPSAARRFTETLDENVLGVTRLNGVASATTRRLEARFDQGDALLVVDFAAADFEVQTG